MVLSDYAADMIRVDKAAARLDRAFETMGRRGVVMLSVCDHDLEFVDAGAQPLDVVERLAFEYMTTPERVAAEILKSPIQNAADCEVINV